MSLTVSYSGSDAPFLMLMYQLSDRNLAVFEALSVLLCYRERCEEINMPRQALRPCGAIGCSRLTEHQYCNELLVTPSRFRTLCIYCVTLFLESILH